MVNKKDIVSFFIEEGHLLSPEALDKIFSTNVAELGDVYFDRARLVMGEDDIKAGRKIEIVHNIEKTTDSISVFELAHLYNRKYEVIRDILVGRFKKEFVSASNLGSRRYGKYNMIGIVRGKEEKEDRIVVEMEDATGSVKIAFSKTVNSIEDVSALDGDDVVGISGTVKDNIIFGEDIIYPDVPLREPVKGYGRMCYMSDLCLDEAPTKDLEKVFSWLSKSNIDYIFIGGKIKDAQLLEKIIKNNCPGKTIFVACSDDGTPSVSKKYSLDNIIGLSNPCVIRINGLTLLFIDRFDLSMVKKRYMNYENRKGGTGPPLKEFIITTVPDIIMHAHTRKPFIENYKSITIINSGSLLTEFIPVIINFETRNYGQMYVDKLK